VTFTFPMTTAGPTNLILRYSAGSGVAYRKVELDVAVYVAKQTFASTGNWNTWSTVTLSPTLTASTHPQGLVRQHRRIQPIQISIAWLEHSLTRRPRYRQQAAWCTKQ
jgi:hypothetical protein